MGELRPLTALPEWNDMFRLAGVYHSLHFRWRGAGEDWRCTAYVINPGCEGVTETPAALGSEKFDVLRRSIEGTGIDIHPAVWEAFIALRIAANGPSAATIEDLL